MGNFSEEKTSAKKNSVNLVEQSKNELKLDKVNYTAVSTDDDEYELIEPDGGWGWFVLAAAMLINILIIGGAVKSFGVLYPEFKDNLGVTAQQVSFIPALLYFLYSSLGPLASILSVKYSYRIVTIIGGSFASVGLILTYWTTSIEYSYISYGVFVGIGAGLCFPLTIYIVTSYFKRLRGLTNGMCLSGSCVGAVILPPCFRVLLNNFGFRGTCLTLGIMMTSVVFAAYFYDPVEKHMKRVKVKKPEIKPVQNGTQDLNAEEMTIILNGNNEVKRKPIKEEKTGFNKYLDLSLLRNPVYLIILFSNCANSIGCTNYTILLPTYAESLGFHRDNAAYLLSIESIFDFIGRLAGSTLSDFNLVPKKWFFIGGSAISGIALAFVPFVQSSFTLFAILCSIFGLATGTYIGITAIVMTDYLGDETLASSYGISMFANGILQLIGPPVCSALYARLGAYQPIFVGLGLCIILGSLLWSLMPLALRITKKKQAAA